MTAPAALAADLATVASRHGLTVPGLVQRLREVADAYRSDPSRCDWCEGAMPESARRDARYCGGRCRQAAARERRSDVTA